MSGTGERCPRRRPGAPATSFRPAELPGDHHAVLASQPGVLDADRDGLAQRDEEIADGLSNALEQIESVLGDLRARAAIITKRA